MTPEEHARAEQNAKALVDDLLLHSAVSTYGSFLSQLPAAARSLHLTAIRKQLSAAQDRYRNMVISGVHPAHSDMQSALFQEALAEKCSQILKQLDGR